MGKKGIPKRDRYYNDAVAIFAGKRAIHEELKRQKIEYDRENAINIDALILWQLHVQLGFGKKRLRRFYDNFKPAFEQMVNDYEVKPEHRVWICEQLLKDIDVYVEEWHNENSEQEAINEIQT